MKKAPFSLLKYLALLSALLLTVSDLVFKTPEAGTLLVTQIVLGVLYLSFSIADFSGRLVKSSLPYERFFYLPFMVVSSRLIRLGAYTMACVLLFMSHSNLVFLGALLLLVIVADILVFFLRIRFSVYHVSLFANYILFSLEQETKIYASHIKEIEFRYNIFYVKLVTNKVYPIEIDRMKKERQDLFKEKFVIWVVCNRLNFTDEAREQLADIISEAL